MSALCDQIEQVLPQTQCGLCGYKGCRPYAEALAREETSIDLCPPGGIETLDVLAKILQQDPKPYYTEMQHKQKPAQVAVIREDECIGCTKCIQACPLDAIIGASKQLHSILTINCSGCELCISPCPVDCIDLAPLNSLTAQQKEERRERFYHLNQQHQTRLHTQREQKTEQLKNELEQLKLSVDERQSEIKAALERRKASKKAKHDGS